jgi:hypothetical protein
MIDSSTRAGPRRWPRGQKFTISLSGLRADEAYRAAVLAARTAGRSALEAAVAAWAAPFGVAPGDGVVLGELRSQRRGLGELAEALEGCGIDAKEVRAAVDRLVGAGLVDAVPLASQLGA